ncbi:hypothetical protein [Pseudoxanthomonas japonensis]|uniref:hypothetical protein n=1 Tax=Pseudoxanthomonas japonensis TaxID=69284 RepID=UPI0037492DBC
MRARPGCRTPSGIGTSFSTTPAAGDDLTCTSSNGLGLRLRRWPSPTRTGRANRPGGRRADQRQQTTYAIVAMNDGPEPVNNTMLRDTPEAGLSACKLAGPACEVTGGTARCPAAGTGKANGRWPTCDPLHPLASR